MAENRRPVYLCGNESGRGLVLNLLRPPDFQRAIEEGRPGWLAIDTTNQCAGGCIYCYSGSTENTKIEIPRERVLSLVDEAAQLGIQAIMWMGGDPLLHPSWVEFLHYAREKGLANSIVLNPMTLSKKACQEICRAGVDALCLHIDTLDPQVYRQINHFPKTLEMKIRGYRNLLEEGFPPERVYGVLTFCQPVAQAIDQTLDWFVDEMGSPFVYFDIFKTGGFGSAYQELEPSLTEIRRSREYRARKLGDDDLRRMGSSDAGADFCRLYFNVTYDGRIRPCPFLHPLSVGNIYQENLAQILEKHRELLLFDFPVQGYCGDACENRDLCFGCRANAYYYAGDVWGSDPKCWLNPSNPEHVFRK